MWSGCLISRGALGGEGKGNGRELAREGPGRNLGARIAIIRSTSFIGYNIWLLTLCPVDAPAYNYDRQLVPQ